MQIIPQFDPSITTSGTINVGASDAGSKLLLYNKSPYDLNLDFFNGNQSLAHAREARFWTLDGDTKEIGWSIESSQKVVAPAISLVQGELYAPHENLEGAYPVQLDTQTDASNSLLLNNRGAFASISQFKSGAQTINIALPSSPNLTTYITNLIFSSDICTAGTQSYTIVLTNIQTNNIKIYAVASTTQGAFAPVTFSTPAPAIIAGDDISANVSGTANSGNFSLVLIGYQV